MRIHFQFSLHHSGRSSRCGGANIDIVQQAGRDPGEGQLRGQDSAGKGNVSTRLCSIANLNGLPCLIQLVLRIATSCAPLVRTNCSPSTIRPPVSRSSANMARISSLATFRVRSKWPRVPARKVTSTPWPIGCRAFAERPWMPARK